MINRVILVGNLGLDPEVRALQSGQAVANFSIATNRRFKDSDGARQQRTDWHSVVAYGKQAELVGRLLTRGRLIYLEGRIETQTWEDKASHEKRSKTIIVCETFQLLGAKPADNDQAADEGDQAPDTGHGPAIDDDIPF